jgi:hypothetical protein
VTIWCRDLYDIASDEISSDTLDSGGEQAGAPSNTFLGLAIYHQPAMTARDASNPSLIRRTSDGS